ncbi:unnamed protein product [Penicillium pancosmium]
MVSTSSVEPKVSILQLLIGSDLDFFLPGLSPAWEYHLIQVLTMSTNRPFLSNFLAAFRAQSTYKAASQSSTGTPTLSSAQISQSARAIATKAANSASATSSAGPSSTAHHTHHHHTSSTSSSSGPATATAGPASSAAASNHSPPSHHYHHAAPDTPLTASPPPTPSSSSTPIPINRGPERQRRGSDSSSGSGGFRDALGPEKWYIGGRTPAGEERFYRLGMVTKGGGRLGGGGRVGSIDQLSL